MNNDERIQAFKMRLDGHTWDEIAAVLYYTAPNIRRELIRCVSHVPLRPNCVYPALRAFIIENCGGSVNRFARLCDANQSSIANICEGIYLPRQRMRDKITAATGLTEEEAFYIPEGMRETL